MPLSRRITYLLPTGSSFGVAAALILGITTAFMDPVFPAEPDQAGPVPRLPGDSPTGGHLTNGSFLGYETAVRIGLEQHPLVRKSKQSALAAGAVTEIAESKYYPELNAYAIQTGGTIRPLSAFNVAGAQNKPTSYVESAGVRADQLLYDFGQTAHRILAERAGQEATEKDILTSKALVILRVQQEYIRCVQQQRLVRIAEEMVRQRGILRDQIETFYKRELRSKLDLNLIAVELRNAEVQLVQAKNELRASFAGLNNAMGIKGAEDYTLEEKSSFDMPTAGLDALVQQAMNQRPEVLGSFDRIRQAQEQLNSAQALNLPTISALGMYGVIHFSDAPTNQYAGSHPGQTNLWWGAGATLSVPIFTGFLIENRVAEAKQQRYKAEQRKEELSNRIALEVSESYFALQTAQQQIKVEEKEVEFSRSALRLAQERYRLGLASIVDVTTATTALLMAEVRLAESRYAVHASATALSYAVGEAYRQF
jgi:outer membrane protein